MLRQKKNDENSNISQCKNIILKKSSKRKKDEPKYLSFKNPHIKIDLLT
jgi:hypothetical protein